MLIANTEITGHKMRMLCRAAALLSELKALVASRDHEVREHIPVPYDNLFQSILSCASRRQCYF